MSKQRLAPVQAVVAIDAAQMKKQYTKARDFFYATPLRFGAMDAVPAPDDADISSQGQVQFHLIGQAPTDPAYSDIMNENANNLLGMGGLVFDYMHKNYPTVNSAKLDIDTWQNVISNIPDLAIGTAVSKNYKDSIKGVTVSGQFLSMIASAIITDGASLLIDFTSYLNGIGNVTFSAHVTGESYNALTCTYQSYLVSNGVGGWYDYGAIVLRQITFNENFMQLKGCCATVDSVDIDMSYTEIANLVRTSRIRKGGPDYDNFQNLINANATAQFTNAKNFFNAPSTPQADITPKV